MTSKKTATSKRAPRPRAADYAKWQGHRECHIGGDFLLAYKHEDSAKHGLVIFVRAGTHADLFE